MFITERANGFAKFVTDERIHKEAVRMIIQEGEHEFEYFSAFTDELVAVRFVVDDKPVSTERAVLFNEFYTKYWAAVDKARAETK